MKTVDVNTVFIREAIQTGNTHQQLQRETPILALGILLGTK